MKNNIKLTMNTLIKDVILRIFKFLLIHEILTFGRTNKHFMKMTRSNILPKTFTTWNPLFMQRILKNHTFKSYVFVNNIRDNDLQILRNKLGSRCTFYNCILFGASEILKHFNEIEFDDCSILSNKCFENLSGCESLKFINCDITDQELEVLKKCHKLSIVFNKSIISSGLTKINCYCLDISCFDYPIDEYIQNLNCDKLILARCKSLTDEGLKNLKYFDYIDVSNCVKITDQGIENLKCRKLKIGECSLLTYTNTKNLKCIDLDVSYSCNIYNETLKTFPIFKSLNLSGCSITNKGLFYVKNCEKIKLIHCMKITVRGILTLKCKKITICKCMNIFRIWTIKKILKCDIKCVTTCITPN